MKRATLIMALIAMLCAASCSKPSNSPQTQPTVDKGFWTFNGVKYTTVTSGYYVGGTYKGSSFLADSSNLSTYSTIRFETGTGAPNYTTTYNVVEYGAYNAPSTFPVLTVNGSTQTTYHSIGGSATEQVFDTVITTRSQVSYTLSSTSIRMVNMNAPNDTGILIVSHLKM